MRGRPRLAELLDLAPHPEGGWYRRTWTSSVPAGGDRERQTASAVYYLLHPGEESAWHRVASDELWLWHHGHPLELRLGGEGERPGEPVGQLLGTDIEAGQLPQLLVPAGTWQTARPTTGPVLVTCVVSPEFHFADFTLLD
ncbi:cupin domain-containing protein [Actinocorallia sp. A-T 12471]|uniref:cupin domain-containing protein n=1 Tax=Actinocorallia sp. A-T 12471 TaxID=3089813 RepID=UPI0029D0EF8C|nr:cupin domain-containing protein [Actinocorallia sp. A-T 12471]MDX6742349.1 cupin domain-containing protein [Actinocorallia sp. A-T 12471]